MNNKPAPYVTRQERKAEKRRQSDVARESLELRDTLELPAAQAVFTRILRDAGVIRGIQVENAKVYRLTAVQDFGLKLLDEMFAAHSVATMEIIRNILEERDIDDT